MPKKSTPRPSTKVNSKWITDLNVKHKIITLTEDNICVYSGPLRKAEFFFLSPNRITLVKQFLFRSVLFSDL